MKNVDDIIAELTNYNAFKGTIKTDELIGPKTTFRIGGKAALYIAPQNYYSFQILLTVLNAHNTKFCILGGCSNIVFTDDYYDGVVISTREFSGTTTIKADDLPFEFGTVKLENNQILVTCFAGTSISSFLSFCKEKNISGAEQFAGLPGTVGGAVYMNARCFDKSISDILFSTSYMNFESEKVTLERCLYNSKDWDYKKSPFQNKKLFITTVTFVLTQKKASDRLQIESDCKKYISERESKGHFKFPSAGSVFKNNHAFGAPSGKLIDECGLKGFQIGGAQIAPFHGNFIINSNNATARDVKELVNYVQEQVKNKFGFLLENEIIFVDN